MITGGVITARLRDPARQLGLEHLVVLAVTAGMALSTAVAIKAMAAGQPLLAAVAALAVPLGLAALAWPDLSSLLVIFVLYTNAAVIAVQFHGVPYIVGAAAPALLILPLAHYAVFRREAVVLTPGLPLIVLFVTVQMVGALSAKVPSEATRVLAISLVEGVGLYVVITNVVRSPEVLRGVVWTLLGAGAFMGALSVYQQATRTYADDYGGFAQLSAEGFQLEDLEGKLGQPRLSGPIGEKNRYAQIMLMLIPLGLFRVWGERSLALRVLAATATALCAVACALTFSRGAAVGFVLVLVIMTFLRYIRPYQLGAIVLGACLLMAALPNYAARLASLASAWTMVSGAGNPGEPPDGAVAGRATEMLAAARVFAAHPLIGVGPGMFKYYAREYGETGGMRALGGNREAHSLYLGLAADHGLLGLAAFLAILLTTLRRLARTRGRNMQARPELANMATAFILVIVTYMTTGLFLHFSFVRYFWLMLALADVAGGAGEAGGGRGIEPAAAGGVA